MRRDFHLLPAISLPQSSSKTSDKPTPSDELKEAVKTLKGAANRVGEEIPKAADAAVSAIKKATGQAKGNPESEERKKNEEK